MEIGFNALLGAVLSSRVNLKVLNERAETSLLFIAEPLASLAGFYGYDYPSLNLERAWKSLLQNHAHDSICGSAIDQAHKDMLYRFSETTMVSEEVGRRALEHLWTNISFENAPDGELTLTVFNTLTDPREEIAPLIFDLPLDNDLEHFDVYNLDGEKVPHEIVWSEEIDMRCERELDSNAVTFPAKRHYMLMPIDVPACGYTSYIIARREPRYVPHPPPIGCRELIARQEGTLENEHMKVTVNENGTFDLMNKDTGKEYNGLHYFTDGSEAGHAHMTKTTIRDFTVSSIGSQAKITLLETSTLRGVLKIELEMDIPATASFDGRDRSRHTVKLPITTWLTLTKGSKRLEIKTRVDNTARDHRLRVNFPTDIQTDISYAESAFAVEERSLIWTDTGDNFEQYFTWKPMQNFVDVHDGKNRLAFLNKGMREYEVIDDPRRTLAVTVLRTHRSYMTANEKMTPEELDQHKGSHVPGELEFTYALYPHAGSWEEADVLEEAYAFKVPLRILQGVRKEDGSLPPAESFITIEPRASARFSALKKAESGEGYILRVWNSSNEAVECRLKINLPVNTVQRVAINEQQPEDVAFQNGAATLKIKPCEIITLLLEE